ncbi:pyruvate carboxylase [Marinoscillum furvescens]|uniref:Pyruvate carboxylase n=1 Tax=Marinoscillum furvescens DSM 4134 TaxID=1122208 RepID=A0A3D9KWE0_MARFU|nr:pyruvate carboxylase [Marinoscillum furvescens]RED92047.1 pyruvate carboxylase [Marinoscillum furvescens DSM 4134]
MENHKFFKKIMVANRGEIAIRVLRAISELHIRSVAVYTHEDRYSLHRFKADEAYQLDPESEPLKPYLDIEQIIAVAKENDVDAIHPGYGFLSENVTFATRCREEGITFIGPEPEVMSQLGDKVMAKKVARAAEVPVIEDNQVVLSNEEVAKAEAKRIGYPVILKASAGGGGRGMRVVRDESTLIHSFAEARSEAGKAFGDDTIFLEKYVENPKHIEVQVLADNHGNVVHLYERDCSVQRRFQKVVEVAPSEGLKDETRERLYAYALKIARQVNYNNAGTVEFLIDPDENIYFIEVNPRVQVEHTITEEVTGVDIVRSQILIAAGCELSHPQIYIKSQDDIRTRGYAIQCRVTTEDPENGFRPDYGTIIAYRSAGGFGIRLDAGNVYNGVKISPFFDSLLVKVTAKGRTLKGSAQRLHRALREFRVRGVKTNIGFLENVIYTKDFFEGKATVNFIDSHPELFQIKKSFDRGTKTLSYIGEVSVNGNPDVKSYDPNKKFRPLIVPKVEKGAPVPEGTRDLLKKLGREKFVEHFKNDPKIYFTDTTWRDAHQSLLATRFRTADMLKVARSYAVQNPEIFSLEMWGGATFDVSMRFLKESPWKRLQLLREAVPNILFQMLLRGSNGVGYTAYPDNLIEQFIETSAKNGMDIFRIFDSLNWIDNMKVSINAVRERTESLAEACICYTGELQDPDQKKYTLQYYVDMARQLEDAGAHMLAIKDMAGLLKPYTAEKLVGALKEAVDLPIHLHTHDTSSVQSAMYLKAVEAGVDIVDGALASMSGLTSQPNLNSLVATLQYHERGRDMNLDSLNQHSTYFEGVRDYYYPFESELKAGTAEVYHHEIPGGQYSNLRPQAIALGLEHKFETIKRNYAIVNKLFGDIVKVTPSSKVVGDMAMFMTSNGLTPEDIVTRGESLSFPESVVGFFRGELGQPHGGFPAEISKLILKNQQPLNGRANDQMDPVDFDKEFAAFQKDFPGADFEDFLSYKLYPKVYKEYYDHIQQYDEVSHLPSPVFFYGMKEDEEILVEIAKGKTIIIEMGYITEPDEEGMRTVSFKLNGQSRKIQIRDKKASVDKVSNRKADGPGEVGSPLQGRIAEVKVKKGAEVKKGDVLFVIEAMKMETSVSSPKDGVVTGIQLRAGDLVQQDDLVIELD